ncbi:MAG: hypothetical protein L6Q77_01840 [Bacteroidetes bacterium]|nr:hypothetical protein [Bacteroidota bacterium]
MPAIFSARLFLFGFYLWIIPFVAAIPLFQLLSDHRIVFKGIMGVVMTLTTAVLWTRFLKKIPAVSVKEAVQVSLLWMTMSIVPDLFAFILGFNMEVSVYFSEIAVSYLVIPILLITSALQVKNT